MRNSGWLTAIVVGVVAALCWASLSAPACGQKPAETPAQSAERILDELTTLEFVETPLRDVVSFLATNHKVRFELAEELKAGPKRLNPDTAITRNLKEISLRSALHLLLAEYGVEHTVTPEGTLRLVHSTPELQAKRVESKVQQERRAKLEKKLATAKADLQVVDTPLHDVLAYLADVTDCTLVLSRQATATAGIEPDEPITAEQPELPLGQLLKCILVPFDLQVIIQDEVVMIVPRDKGAKVQPSAEVAKALETKLDLNFDDPLWMITRPLTKQTGVPFALHYSSLKGAGIELYERVGVKAEQTTPAQCLLSLKPAVPLKLVERDGVLLITADPAKKPIVAQELTVSTDSLETVLENLKASKAILIDVRESVERDVGRIGGSFFLPTSQFQDKATRDRLARITTRKVIVYMFCGSGERALTCAKLMKQQGFDARALKFGYEDFLKAGFEKAK